MPGRKELWSDVPKPFLEHLEDLRRTLLVAAALLVLGMAVTLPFTPLILDFLRAPLGGLTDDPEQFLRSLEITGGFTIALRTSFWTGLLVAAPGLALLAAKFVFPALRQVERRILALGLAGALALFIGGAALGYHLVLPTALKMMFGLHTWLDIRAEWTITSYVAFAVQLLLGFGLAFELPVLLLALGRLELASSTWLRAHRRHAIVLIFILATVLTPPDVFSQVLMALPMILLFEACIWIITGWERCRTMTPDPE
ncbi:MAG: twin-arginine translocase subunit TatC [Kiritimatiellia bacterium]|nr:twin-arginine translocase subunit TatC [Lentisphaerota bacterium]